MRKILLTCLILAGLNAYSQDISFSKPGKNYYEELPNPAKADPAQWAKLNNDINVSFASADVRYPKEAVPGIPVVTEWKGTAWKGEKIHTQLLVWTRKDIPSVSFKVSDLRGNGASITKMNVKPAFVRYVMTDEYGGGCTKRKPGEFDSSLVADPLDIISKIPVKANTVQPLWLTIEVPAGTKAGLYKGKLTITAGSKYDLNISVNVLDHVLPPASEWKYDLDLWQYPAPIARIHDVELWSDEHFRLMRPYLEYLAKAGQKVITANIINQPWGMTHVHFDDPTLIKWTRKKDGSWSYDYTMFDKYVAFVMSCGINQRINCYTMVTWDMTFKYFDEASGGENSITGKPGTKEYTDFWTPMIKDFTKHLKEKGWFAKTAIAMDERPIESMQEVIKLLKGVDPSWRIALAGDEYHPEIGNDIFDYSIASYLKFDDELLSQRKAQGKPSTFYTACKEINPGPYTFSPPADNTWLGWHASAKGYTGYLFWAYNTWVKSPLLDSRFKSWPAGTCYQFYPGPRTSIRFEKLIEGIQDFEKIRILREQFKKEGNAVKLRELDAILSEFDISALTKTTSSEMLKKAKEQLNRY